MLSFVGTTLELVDFAEESSTAQNNQAVAWKGLIRTLSNEDVVNAVTARWNASG